MKIAIVGGSGFLGWHLRCRLRAKHPEEEPRVIDRSALSDPEALAEQLRETSIVFHLAAVNTHDERACENVEIADALVDALGRVDRPPHVVYSNSLHAEQGSPYGRAKRAAANSLRRWADSSGGSVADVLLPNLFGEGGRPHYNSAVATFCHAIAAGAPTRVNPTGRVKLLHAQDAAEALIRSATKRGNTQDRVPGTTLLISDVYERLTRFHEIYAGTHSIPALLNRLDLRLFNQLRSAMFPDAYPVRLPEHVDSRGSFFEAVRGAGQAQTSFSTTAPGVTRGDHWHFDKIERFLVLRGTATIEIRPLFGDTIHRFDVKGDEPSVIDMPTLHAHNITNVGDEQLLTMFWANDHFDPAAPDTHPEPVRLSGAKP